MKEEKEIVVEQVSPLELYQLLSTTFEPIVHAHEAVR